MISRRSGATGGQVALGCLVILALAIGLTVAVSWLFMIAWNLFVFGVLGLTREITLFEAFIGVVLIEIIGSAFRSVSRK